MPTIRELLDTINEDQFLQKLSSQNNQKSAKPTKTAGQKRADEQITPGPGTGPASAPGSATAPSEAPSGADVTGVVNAGGPPNVLADQLGGTSADRRLLLMDAAMRAAGQELAAGVEGARGVGTDEEHNHGTQPSSGSQEFANVAAPQTPVFQDNYQKQVEDAAGAGMGDMKAASVLDRLVNQVTGTKQAKQAATRSQNGVAPTTRDEAEKLAAAKIANECIAQGLFVERGIEMGLEKAAEEGRLAEIFAPSIAAAHEVAFENLAKNAECLDKVAEALADRVAAKLAEKLGIQGK
jgi:hypothetical protein